MSSEEYTVQYGNKEIGQLDKAFPIKLNDNIILAGKLWSIISIDIKRDKVYVETASNAKPPKYFGGGIKLHSRILEKIMELLCNTEEFNYLNEAASDLLKDLRTPYQKYKVKDDERIIWESKDEMIFEAFIGTKIVKTLVWMLKVEGVDVEEYDVLGRVKIAGIYQLGVCQHSCRNFNF